MNSDSKYSMKTNTVVGNMKLIFDCKFIGYVVFISFDDKTRLIEFPSGISGSSRYYRIEHFGYNVMQTIAANYFDYAFSKTQSECALSEDILSKYDRTGEKRTVANIKQVKSTGEFIYIMNNVVYTAHFPVEWALEHESTENGPGTSPTHCHNCNYYGSYRGVFIGYCFNCSMYNYDLSRGYGFDEGKEQDLDMVCWQFIKRSEFDNVLSHETDVQHLGSSMFATYLKNVPLETLGYDSDGESCLSGGQIPTTPDICDNQSDLDPENLYKQDDELYSSTVSSVRESKRYPRRAYGIPSFIRHEVLMTQTITPDFIRNKLERLFVANEIEVTDNNYSFPIGYREEWDHYRTQKHPCYWYAWNIILKAPLLGNSLSDARNQKYCNTHIQVRLYLSNPSILEKPCEVVLACNTSDNTEANTAYWSMIRHMSDWILDKTETPKFSMEKLEYYGEDTDSSTDDYSLEPLDTEEDTSEDDDQEDQENTEDDDDQESTEDEDQENTEDDDDQEDTEEDNTQPQTNQDDTWEIIVYCIIVYFVIVFYSR